MVQGKNLEQKNINPEQLKPIEKPLETSLDSTKVEQITEQQIQEKSDNSQISVPISIADIQTDSIRPASSEVIHRQVEDILSVGMENVFLSLDAGTQRAFKLKGEETAIKITNLLMQTKIKVGEITKLILEWLRIIPSINKHYLEQEAKIKTDNILKINQKNKNE